jgi:polar amino acid transport system substrate-binding protein
MEIAFAATLVLGFVPRPGLAEVIDGQPSGSYLPLAVAAARKAGLEFTLEALPQKRLLSEVSVNRPNYCALGIYVTPERAAYGKYSQPFFRDPPLIVVAVRSKEAAFHQHRTFAALTGDTRLRLGVIAGYAYGAVLDPVLSAMHGNIETFVGTYNQNFAKIVAGRVDYVLSFPAEFETVSGRFPEYGQRLVRIDYPDIPAGVTRHFLCSKAVSDTLLEQLNGGIGPRGPASAP